MDSQVFLGIIVNAQTVNTRLFLSSHAAWYETNLKFAAKLCSLLLSLERTLIVLSSYTLQCFL